MVWVTTVAWVCYLASEFLTSACHECIQKTKNQKKQRKKKKKKKEKRNGGVKYGLWRLEELRFAVDLA